MLLSSEIVSVIWIIIIIKLKFYKYYVCLLLKYKSQFINVCINLYVYIIYKLLIFQFYILKLILYACVVTSILYSVL